VATRLPPAALVTVAIAAVADGPSRHPRHGATLSISKTSMPSSGGAAGSRPAVPLKGRH